MSNRILPKIFALSLGLSLSLPVLAAAQAQGTLVYCSEGSPAGFDQAQFTTGTDFDAAAYTVQNGLVQFKKGSTEVEPALAESWEISDDGLTYTFHLRKNVKFGKTSYFTPSRDFNADDVVATFDRLANKDNAFNKAYPVQFPYYTNMELDKIIKSVKKVDDNTVEFTLNEPNASLIQSLAMPIGSIYSAEYMQQLLKANQAAQINQQPVGTGPFVFQRYQKDAQIRYQANPDYWDKDNLPEVKRLIFAITPDAAVRTQKLLANECHITTDPLPNDVEKFKQKDNLKVLQEPGFNVAFLYYNTEKKPFDNVKVRQALDLAINKEEIVKSVYQGLAEVAPNPIPPSQWSFNKDIKSNPYDPEKAKQLLAEAGLKDGFETTLWALPVQRPYNPNGRLMAEMVQADWAKIGVKVKIQTYEWGEYVKRAQAGEHDIFMMGWTGDNGDPDNWFSNLFTCSSVGGGNYSRYCNKDFDPLITKARKETDQAARSKLYEQAQVLYHEQMPASPIATSTISKPMVKALEGFKISPFSSMLFKGVKLDK
nr:ABC transporter substrate-binding protein [Brackiella oedipodis]